MIPKYRAWLKKENRMVEVVAIDFELKTIAYFNGVSRTYVNFNDCDLLQFTGLHDKNGVEIYEGDTIEYGNGFAFDVFHHENGAWMINIFNMTSPSGNRSLKSIKNMCKKIGNKFEGVKGGE